MRNGSLGCYTGANHAECTAEGNENLGPDERDITVQSHVNVWRAHGNGDVIRCVFATSVERKTESDYPDTQTKYLEVLRNKLRSLLRCDETHSNATL